MYQAAEQGHLRILLHDGGGRWGAEIDTCERTHITPILFITIIFLFPQMCLYQVENQKYPESLYIIFVKSKF